jgi:hypothetical protein
MVSLVVAACFFVSCSGQAEFAANEDADPTPRPALAPAPTALAPAPTALAPAPTALPDPTAGATDQEPTAYVPAGQPGTAQGYAELIKRLERVVPPELRRQIPWPDLRTPNPIVAQIDIFDLWIWMAENLTEPQLAEIMAAPGSPSRESIESIFGYLKSQNIFESRPGQQYEAFDHLVVTFESAGLPLWLGRDVPADAVVVYYSDRSGPVNIVDQDTEAIIATQLGIPTRTWLSIMAPTDVGWQLWRDQLIEPNDPELQVPNIAPPAGADADPRPPQV